MDDDIYAFNVLRDVKRGKDVILKTRDKANDTLVVPYAKIKWNNDSITTNDKGEYTFFIEEDTEYSLTASKEKYYNATESLNTKMSEQDEFSKTILMEKDPDISLLAFILDAKTNQAIDAVKVTIKNKANGVEFDNALSSSTGEYKKGLSDKKVGDALSFQITLEKQGYLTKVIEFNHTISKPGEVRLNELLNMTIGKVEVGNDLAKMIDMKPIYFDLGKSKIRPDAARELDKVVAIMKEIPGMTIELGAHTDCRSAAPANLKLSTARAKASATYIASKGVPRERITGKGFGESKLLNGCACEGKLTSTCTEEDHAMNRRTEFIITKLK
jgi:outer membrane protein OmpA-like peptidoglycan-associated protein